MEKANRTGKEILDDLCLPGRILVFVDDSGTPKKPLPLLAGDYVLMCGVAIKSEEYRILKGQLRGFLMRLGLHEFKTKHIVNPPSKSPWKKATLQKRKQSLSLLSDTLARSVEAVVFCHVSGEQYYSAMRPQILAHGGPDISHKEAVEKVFFDSLIPFLRLFGEEKAIVFDSPMPLGDDKIALRPMVDPKGFYEGSVIYVDSRVEVGIQLADFASHLLNRIHHSHQRQLAGKTNCFDEILMSAAKRMEPQLVDLLNIKGISSLDSTERAIMTEGE